jgi:hypothetical protein
MRCSALPQALFRAWPNSVIHSSNELDRSWPHSPTAAPGTYWPTPGASAAGCVRDCRRSDAPAAMMQVRPLSVVSGTAGSSPFGRSAFADSGWL